jgi:putative FmdB family regulatory protein
VDTIRRSLNATKEEGRMPIFEYRCKKCGSQFEALVMNQRETVICESCGSKKLERLMSGFAVSASSGGACSGNSGGT